MKYEINVVVFEVTGLTLERQPDQEAVEYQGVTKVLPWGEW